MFPIKDNIPTDRLPIVTILLIAANVLVYFLWQKGGLHFGDPNGEHYLTNLARYGAVPYELTHSGADCGYEVVGNVANANRFVCSGPVFPADQPSTWITPFTAMFMHGGLLHLGGNMLFLWIFGNNVEDAMGRVRFVVFYVLGGLAALALQVAIDTSAAVPTIGASGAIAAVLGGYLLLYPRARVITVVLIVFFFTVVELPAVAVLVIWFAMQVVFGAVDLSDPTGGGGGVAYFAHIGGFAFGLLAIRAFARRVKDTPARLPLG
jgi:membrane associated rhomboid family serine protease